MTVLIEERKFFRDSKASEEVACQMLNLHDRPVVTDLTIPIHNKFAVVFRTVDS